MKRAPVFLAALALAGLLAGVPLAGLAPHAAAQAPTPSPAEDPILEVQAATGEAQVITGTATATTTQIVTSGIATTPALTTPLTTTVIGEAVTITEAVTTTVAVTTTTAVTAVTVLTQAVPAVQLVITETVPAAFLTINLAAGTPVDPFLVSLQAGGDFSAEGLGPGCAGYVNNAPTVTVDWSGDAALLKAFFYSDHDPVLVVQLPTGEIRCNDDANELLLDPVIQIDNPPAGRYHLWAGSFERAQLIPGLLVLTTDPALTLGSFAPGELVQREPIPEDVISPAEVDMTLLPTVTGPLNSTGVTPLQPGGAPITAAVTVTGMVEAFNLPIEGARCTGYINPAVDYAFTWTGSTSNLRIFFAGDDDASLLVVGPGNMVYCNDDLSPGINLNPQVDIPTPAEGDYLVFVGRLDPTLPLTGVLTIAEASTAEPPLLAPAQPQE